MGVCIGSIHAGIYQNERPKNAGDNLRAAFGWRISPEDLAVAIDKWAGVHGDSGCG